MRILKILPLLLLCGCVGGPTKDHYNPALHGAKFKGPATIFLVGNIKESVIDKVKEGYTIIGTTEYTGKYPEAVELKAQAKRVGANCVVYSCVFIPNPPGSWSFSFAGRFGSGGSGGGVNDVHIAFLGK